MCCCGYVFNGRLTYAATGQEWSVIQFLTMLKSSSPGGFGPARACLTTQCTLNGVTHFTFCRCVCCFQLNALMRIINVSVVVSPSSIHPAAVQYFPPFRVWLPATMPREASKRGQSRRGVSSTYPNPLLSTASMITLHIFFPSCLPV